MPNDKGGFRKELEKSWTALEDPTKGELFINFGSKNESEAEANEGGSRAKRSRVKRTADGNHKNRDDESSGLLVTVVTPKRSDKEWVMFVQELTEAEVRDVPEDRLKGRTDGDKVVAAVVLQPRDWEATVGTGAV